MDLAPDKLADYDDAYSILNEEIIRTYGTGFDTNNEPSFDNFKKALLTVDSLEIDNYLQKEVIENGQILAINAEELLNNDDLILQYYNKNKDVLSNNIWYLFKEYRAQNKLNFEDYLVDNYKLILENNN